MQGSATPQEVTMKEEIEAQLSVNRLKSSKTNADFDSLLMNREMLEETPNILG